MSMLCVGFNSTRGRGGGGEISAIGRGIIICSKIPLVNINPSYLSVA